ncbi:hypothetical protein PPERSA_08190 [Pseudocohnilembus persalinus]|uniref:Uncharacterized protein n=1 Tax=Pseudocohnilembus persalinus TaxID=266149 RepID=A0A0V0R3C1_PSEPJ|nr:hypothetical protein PPERSA_08190 [Pseudocohnilembus persalinus]|eukprot:KRX08987.1 hypothetical protein PPERSA_08190 [Pseudocohnilembus persalinus]
MSEQIEFNQEFQQNEQQSQQDQDESDENEFIFRKIQHKIPVQKLPSWLLEAEQSLEKFSVQEQKTQKRQIYRKLKCPFEIGNLQEDLIYSLEFLNDILSLVLHNQDKEILFYKLFIDFFLNDQDLKGIFALGRLTQCDSEIINKDIQDILITLCGLEKQIRIKMEIYLNTKNIFKENSQFTKVRGHKLISNQKISQALQEQNFAKVILNQLEDFQVPKEQTKYIQCLNNIYNLICDFKKQKNEDNQMHETYNNYTFILDSQSLIFGAFIYNKTYQLRTIQQLYQNSQTFNLFKYDLGDNEDDMKKIQNIFKQLKQQEILATGVIMIHEIDYTKKSEV